MQLEKAGIYVNIVIKFVLKNIIEKKLRTFLILFSIVLSSALFFASQAVTDSVIDMFVKDARQFFSSADIIIQPDADSPQSTVKVEEAEKFAANTEFITGALQYGAYYTPEKNKTISVRLRGTTIEDLETMNSFYTDSPSDIKSFTGRKVIISKKASEAYSLKKGDTIKLEVNGIKVRFVIYAIANPEGFFVEDGEALNIAVPRTALSSIYGTNDSSNVIFVKLKEGVDLRQSLEELRKIYNHYTVEEPIPMEDIANSFASMSAGFMMMTMVVAFMSIFILYTSFKVITLERLPMIGTFRSIGATRRTTNTVLLSESLLYGIIGGTIGCMLGLGILYIITSLITPSYMAGYKIELVYSPVHLVSAFVMAVVLSLVSSILPIIEISKIPVKEVILNAIEKRSKSKIKKYALGFFLQLVYVTLPLLPYKELGMVISVVSVLSAVAGIILLLPLITEGFVRVFEKIYVILFGNIGTIAAKNLRQNKNVLNNISLLSIAISALIMITTISNSVLAEVASFYTRNARFDIYMIPNSANKSFEQSLLTVEGIQQLCGNYSMSGSEIVGRDEKIGSIYGININRFPDYFNLNIQGDATMLFDTLNNERSMIMASALRDKLGMKKGDYLTLKMVKGDVAYKIIGFHNSLLENGNNVLIAEKYFRADTGIQTYAEIYIKTDRDPDTTVEAIKKKFFRNTPYTISLAQMEQENFEMNSSIFTSMEAFAWLTLIIGIFGIINNYLISFIERKRSLAMYRSVGMSRRQIVKMMVAESITGGIIGGIMGILAGLLMVRLVPFLMKSLDFDISLTLNPSTLILSFVIGVVVTLTASISPIVKASKLNLIEAIKYE